MRKQESKSLGDVDLLVTQHPATEAFALEAKLLPLLAPVMGELLDAGLESDMPPELIVPALSKLALSISETGAESLVLDLLKYTQVTYVRSGGQRAQALLNTKAVIDECLSLKDLHYAAWFVIKVNFSDFFDGGMLSLTSLDMPQAEAEKPGNH